MDENRIDYDKGEQQHEGGNTTQACVGAGSSAQSAHAFRAGHCDVRHARDGFVRGDSLNLPIPFGVGDIVTLNCAPFAPVKHALLIYVDNVDCCGVRMIHRDTDGMWYDSALKHAHGWGHYTPMLSPLYRLSSYKGDLPKEERFLLKVRDIIGNDAEKGWELSKMILKSEICGMTAEEIMKLMMQL